MYPYFIVGWISDEGMEMLGLTAFPRNQDKDSNSGAELQAQPQLETSGFADVFFSNFH